MIILFISGQEILLVLALALIFFGAKAIPEIARTLGKGVNEFRKASDDIKKEFHKSTSDLKKDISEVGDSLKNDLEDVKDKFDEPTKKDN
ncbi:MAG: twin-arginine translocase TatA/TatE family subunit [Prolixibacteraceae bacterium]|nr:twin-arginine translocase TatA/TatE family subunit [Prolixibacteraceae bacterium]